MTIMRRANYTTDLPCAAVNRIPLEAIARCLRAAFLPVLLISAANALAEKQSTHIDVAIEGLGSSETKLLLDGIEGDLPSCPAEVWQAIQLGDRMVRAITESRRSRGDYAPVIDTDVEASAAAGAENVKLAEKEGAPREGCWLVRLHVAPGSPVSVRALAVHIAGDGAQDPAFTTLASETPFRIGKPFAERVYENYKSEYTRTALERGYFDAKFTAHRIDVYPDQHAVDVALGFNTGQRYAFGDVRITPQDLPLSDAFLKRLVPFRPGEPYAAERLNAYRERLIGAGYFASISAEPDVENAIDHRVPINTTLQPLPRRAITGGAGFATDIGPRVRGSYEDRFLTRSGHQLEAQLNLSRVISEASTTYRLPSQSPAERWVAFDAGAKRERTETAHSDTLTVGVRSVVVFASGWRRTLALNQSYERFSVSTDRAHTLLLVPSLRLERIHVTPGTNLLDLGWSTNVVVLGAPKFQLSDLSFLQIHAQGRLALPAGQRARLLLRGEAGSSFVAGFAELPPTYRFFAGGDDSVRGFDFKTLGPKDSKGDVRGGRDLLTASIEYERLFADRWSWALFTDAGNAFNGLSGKLRYSAGVGVRWHSPVGSIRFDLAHAIDGGQGGIRVHIGIGQLQ